MEDPDVEGVTIYITDFKRSLADKLGKDFFNEPSQVSKQWRGTHDASQFAQIMCNKPVYLHPLGPEVVAF